MTDIVGLSVSKSVHVCLSGWATNFTCSVTLLDMTETFPPSCTLCLLTPKSDLNDLYASRKLIGPSFFIIGCAGARFLFCLPPEPHLGGIVEESDVPTFDKINLYFRLHRQGDAQKWHKCNLANWEPSFHTAANAGCTDIEGQGGSWPTHWPHVFLELNAYAMMFLHNLTQCHEYVAFTSKRNKRK